MTRTPNLRRLAIAMLRALEASPQPARRHPLLQLVVHGPERAVRSRSAAVLASALNPSPTESA